MKPKLLDQSDNLQQENNTTRHDTTIRHNYVPAENTGMRDNSMQMPHFSQGLLVLVLFKRNLLLQRHDPLWALRNTLCMHASLCIMRVQERHGHKPHAHAMCVACITHIYYQTKHITTNTRDKSQRSNKLSTNECDTIRVANANLTVDYGRARRLKIHSAHTSTYA